LPFANESIVYIVRTQTICWN